MPGYVIAWATLSIIINVSLAFLQLELGVEDDDEEDNDHDDEDGGSTGNNTLRALKNTGMKLITNPLLIGTFLGLIVNVINDHELPNFITFRGHANRILSSTFLNYYLILI